MFRTLTSSIHQHFIWRDPRCKDEASEADILSKMEIRAKQDVCLQMSSTAGTGLGVHQQSGPCAEGPCGEVVIPRVDTWQEAVLQAVLREDGASLEAGLGQHTKTEQGTWILYPMTWEETHDPMPK